MVLEPSVASYGTPSASSLYSMWARLDNLGHCVDVVSVAGDGLVSLGEDVRTRMLVRARVSETDQQKSGLDEVTGSCVCEP